MTFPESSVLKLTTSQRPIWPQKPSAKYVARSRLPAQGTYFRAASVSRILYSFIQYCLDISALYKRIPFPLSDFSLSCLCRIPTWRRERPRASVQKRGGALERFNICLVFRLQFSQHSSSFQPAHGSWFAAMFLL